MLRIVTNCYELRITNGRLLISNPQNKIINCDVKLLHDHNTMFIHNTGTRGWDD